MDSSCDVGPQGLASSMAERPVKGPLVWFFFKEGVAPLVDSTLLVCLQALAYILTL